MQSILEIPEIRGLEGHSKLIRIPNQIDVPVTDRILRLLDVAVFQRLKGISQLGLVSYVYPGATHNRFEHSLGVYRNCLLFLRQLADDSRFCEFVGRRDAEILMLAALFHDIGHWPFCHPIEDMEIIGLPTHEQFAETYCFDRSVEKLLEVDWDIEAQEVVDLINRKRDTPKSRLLCSVLSGPIDIDKMDYLYRDSLHAGVPYGQNFDTLRLIRSLCLNESGDRMAITRKGRTAAELMVVARYVMFSEVYWHHAVRSATAMFQRAFYCWHQSRCSESGFDAELLELFQLSEYQMVGQLRTTNDSQESLGLFQSLFGNGRKLYKRLASYSSEENERLYRCMAQKPYAWLVEKSRELEQLVAREIGQRLPPGAILIDAPPIGLEVQFDVDVSYPENQLYRKLGDVSPVVKTLAQKQFDDFVKQVRIFINPDVFSLAKKLSIDEMTESVVS